MTNTPKTHRQPRRDRVRRLVTEADTHGVTWREVAEMLGIDHGAASGALAVLQDAGDVVRLRTRRRGCGVYVLASIADPGDVAPRRRTAAKVSEEDTRKAFDAGWMTGYDEALLRNAEKAARQRQEGAQRLQAELLRVGAAMLQAIDPNASTVVHRGDCWRNHPACAVRAMTKAIAEPKHIMTASQMSPIKWTEREARPA